MKLSKLLENVTYTQKGEEVEITHLQKNANDKCSGGLFFCYKGVDFDGKDYLEEAINNGAVAVIVEEFFDIPITQIKVENVRKERAKICSNFFDRPDKKLKIIGISGTNGKTTSSYIIKNILEVCGKSVGVIGTNAIYIGGVFYKATLTTPDSIDLFEIFDKMVKAEVEYVIMEVSAHALDLYKVWGIKFEVGLFTNFTQDHLDYFENMENYKKVKQSFFNASYCKTCVFNFDDEVGREFAKICDCKTLSYGIIYPSDLFAINIEMSLKGSKFVVNFNDEIMNIESNLCGKFNVYNIMGAICVSKLLNISNDAIVAGLYSMPEVAGRFNLYTVQDKTVVIDFAHTPDGVENVLRTAKSLTKGQIITVFGCGGNRDSSKRCSMGRIAAKYSDKVIITSDNPRFEDPYKIIEDIKVGCPTGLVIENRKKAIITAVTTAFPQATILILGKGAEDYQEIEGVKIPYSDKGVVEELILSEKYRSKKE